MSNKYLSINNVSTIVTTIALVISTPLTALILSFWAGFPLTEAQVTSVIVFILTVALAYVNAKYHNTIFDKETDTINIPLEELSETQINELQSIIAQFTNNTGEFDEEQ